MHTSILLTTLLAFASANSQTPFQSSASDPFSLLALHSATPSIHLRPITASSSRFYINLSNTSTALTSSGSSLSLYTSEAAKQAVFVTSSGELGYTTEDSSTPEGASTRGFEYRAQGVASTGEVTWESFSFVACPTTGMGKDVYQVLAGNATAAVPVDSKCVGIVAGTVAYEGAETEAYA